METKISFSSDGLKLSGIVHTPDDLRSGERRPAFIVLHGFGGNKDGHGQSVVAKQFTEWGYVTMRIDFRGCGESEGEHGQDHLSRPSGGYAQCAELPRHPPGSRPQTASHWWAAVSARPSPYSQAERTSVWPP